MRIVLTIPDEFHRAIQPRLKGWGYMTTNDFVLDCIRQRQRELESRPPTIEDIQRMAETNPALVTPDLTPKENTGITCFQCSQVEAGLDGLSVHLAQKHGKFYTNSQLEGLVKAREQGDVMKDPEGTTLVSGRPCYNCGKDRGQRATCPHCGAVDFS